MQRPMTRGTAAGAGLIFHVFAQDSTSTSGAGKASIAYGSWTCYYVRNGEVISGAITPQDIATLGTYAAPTANTNLRIKAVDNTNMIGIYEIQIHADWVNATNTCQSLTIYLTAAGVAVLPIQIPLQGFTHQLVPGETDAVQICGTNAAATYANFTVSGTSALGAVTATTIGASGAVTAASLTMSGALQAATIVSTGTTTLNALAVTTTTRLIGNVTHEGTTVNTGVVTHTGGTGLGAITGTLPANFITATSIASSAITDAKFATDTACKANHSSTMRAGSGSTTAVLSLSASDKNDFYDGAILQITAGTAVGQSRIISAYNGSTQVATILEAWATTPVVGDTYVVLPLGDVEIGAMMPGTITATAIATGAITNAKFAAGAIDAAAIANGAIDNATFAADVGTTAIATNVIGIATRKGIAEELNTAIPGSPTSNSINERIATMDTSGVLVATGGIDTGAFAAGAINAAAIAADAIGAAELAQDAAQEIADEMLDRNIAGGGSGNTRNVRNALRALRNKVGIVGATLTVMEEDDGTPAWTAAVTRTAGTDPITNIDPA